MTWRRGARGNERKTRKTRKLWMETGNSKENIPNTISAMVSPSLDHLASCIFTFQFANSLVVPIDKLPGGTSVWLLVAYILSVRYGSIG